LNNNRLYLPNLLTRRQAVTLRRLSLCPARRPHSAIFCRTPATAISQNGDSGSDSETLFLANGWTQPRRYLYAL